MKPSISRMSRLLTCDRLIPWLLSIAPFCLCFISGTESSWADLTVDKDWLKSQIVDYVRAEINAEPGDKLDVEVVGGPKRPLYFSQIDSSRRFEY